MQFIHHLILENNNKKKTSVINFCAKLYNRTGLTKSDLIPFVQTKGLLKIIRLFANINSLITKQHAQWAVVEKCFQGESHQKKTCPPHLFCHGNTAQCGRKTNGNGNYILKLSECKVLWSKEKIAKTTLKWPISEGYKTYVFVWTAGLLAFWRQDRLGFL